MRSGLPRVDDRHTRGLKVLQIPGHHGHAVNKRGGRNERVARLGTCSASHRWATAVSMKDTAFKCWQNVPALIQISRCSLSSFAGGNAGRLTLCPVSFLRQYPTGGTGMLCFRQTFARPTSDMPNPWASVRMGVAQTFSWHWLEESIHRYRFSVALPRSAPSHTAPGLPQGLAGFPLGVPA